MMKGVTIRCLFTLKTPKTTNLSFRRIFFQVDFGFWGGLLAFWWSWIGLTRSI